MKNRLALAFAIAGSLLLGGCGAADAPRAVAATQTAPAAATTKGPGKAAVASSHRIATDAGLEVLARGGNAFDAAIAVGATLAVIEPSSSGLGGGGFFLLHRASDDKDIFLDAREMAPSGSRSELWADAEGKLDYKQL